MIEANGFCTVDYLYIDMRMFWMYDREKLEGHWMRAIQWMFGVI